MNKNLRIPTIAGNWKMNKNPKEAASLIDEIIPIAKNANCNVIVCVPFVDLGVAVEKTKDTGVRVGAQNCHFEKSGAFTGEISAKMLYDVGVQYVILGHSERRVYFCETDEIINKKVKAALQAGLRVILCVGENLEQRQNETTHEVISEQLKMDLSGIKKEELQNIIVAYEPIWAIGTGKTATPAQADEVCAWIREVVKELYDNDESDKIIIQYGGSMNAKNAAELLLAKNIDGGLIGGAALKAVDFGEIIKAASKKTQLQ